MATKIYKFFSTSCFPCRNLSAILSGLPSDYNTAAIEDVDIEVNPELARRYNIKAVPTLVRVDLDTDKVVGVLVGLPSPATVKGWLTGGSLPTT